MALAAKISAAELSAQVTNRFQGQYFEARLINAPGITYTPGTTDDTTFLASEVALGTGGYARETFNYTVSDIATYTDGGVGLAQKATTFAHDGSGTSINFTHVALVWSDGNAATLSAAPSAAPTAAVDGTYTSVPVDSTSGSGVGLTVDIVVTNSGATSGDYDITINKPGYGYAASDTVTIADTTLAGISMITGGAGALTTAIATINDNTENAGDLLSVAKTTNSVVLAGGNEAVFYWNLKQYGYYESLLAV